MALRVERLAFNTYISIGCKRLFVLFFVARPLDPTSVPKAFNNLNELMVMKQKARI